MVEEHGRRLDHMGLLLIDKDIITCPERRKMWIKTAASLAFLLCCANVSLLLALVQKDFSNVSPSTPTTMSQDMALPTNLGDGGRQQGLPRRLPSDFRFAKPEECPAASKDKLTNFANASMTSKIPYSHQKDFVMGGYQKIDKGSGDFRLVAPLTMKLSRVQHEHGIFGTVAELGVHHGRFTGTLFVTARETEKLLAADLFEDLQYQNIDVSGYGNKQAFLRGLQSYGLQESDLHLIHTGSTEDLPFDWHIQKDFEPFRLISVDAGHTAGLTFNDLEVAFCNSLRGAIVILDDFFHNLWPGVTEGFFQFAGMGPIEGVYPFLRCEGKAFVTNDKSMHEQYIQAMRTDEKLRLFLSPYAHNVRGNKVKYMMNGVEYLKCDTEKLTRETTHLLWNSLVY